MFWNSICRSGRQLSSSKCHSSSFQRSFHSSSANHFKVTVIGAAGGIGQPLSLLMKQSKLVSDLRLFDVAPITPGVACDLSHINTGSSVRGYTGEEMNVALKDADMVIVPAGVPRKPGMTRDDLFNINAGIVANIARTSAIACPNAFFLIISNPVNSTVPIFAEILKKAGKYNNKRLFGVTTLDVVRANTFVAANQKFEVSSVSVPVIGGHAGKTILPLLSQVKGAKFTQADKEALTQRIMFGGDEVVKAKAGGGSATLSMAYAGALFADKVLRAASGERGLIECTYVDSNLKPGLAFFASPVQLGTGGIDRILPLPQLDEFEQKKFEEAVSELKESIQKGLDFANKP